MVPFHKVQLQDFDFSNPCCGKIQNQNSDSFQNNLTLLQICNLVKFWKNQEFCKIKLVSFLRSNFFRKKKQNYRGYARLQARDWKFSIKISQLSTLKSSLCNAGNSKWGADLFSFPKASMCSILISLKKKTKNHTNIIQTISNFYLNVGIFVSKASQTVTSPLMGSEWFRSSSSLNALTTAWLSLLISPTPFKPGRSKNKKKT